MSRLVAWTTIALVHIAFGSAAASPAASSSAGLSPEALTETITSLDAKAFDAFNHCAAPERLQDYADHFVDDVEFYHDTGGVTWTRQDMIASTAKYACGNYTRELVPGSVRVYAVKDFGAIEQGVHRFCQVSTGACEGMADFVIVWRQQGGKWLITRVLSYGHRPNK
jgi:Domain of unknown function (DUF4440)